MVRAEPSIVFYSKKINQYGFMAFLSAVFVGLWFMIPSEQGVLQLGSLFILFGQSGMDLLCAYFSFSIFKRLKEKKTALVFLFFLLSFLSAFLADFSYNLLLNVMLFDYKNEHMVMLFDLPFFGFLLFQLCAWSVIFFQIQTQHGLKLLSFRLGRPELSFLLLGATLFVAFVGVLQWKIGYFSFLGSVQLVDSILESVSFFLVVICLSRTSDFRVSCMALGYLFVLFSDFMIRSQVIQSIVPFMSIFEISWMAGLLCFGFGLKKIQAMQNYSLSSSFFSDTGIHMYLCSFINFWFVVALLVGLSGIVSLKLKGLDVSFFLQQVFSACIIPCSIAGILFSKKAASIIAVYMNRMTNLVLSRKDVEPVSQLIDDHPVFEFELLEAAIRHHLHENQVAEAAHQDWVALSQILARQSQGAMQAWDTDSLDLSKADQVRLQRFKANLRELADRILEGPEKMSGLSVAQSQ